MTLTYRLVKKRGKNQPTELSCAFVNLFGGRSVFINLMIDVFTHVVVAISRDCLANKRVVAFIPCPVALASASFFVAPRGLPFLVTPLVLYFTLVVG